MSAIKLSTASPPFVCHHTWLQHFSGDFEVWLYESGNKDLLYTGSPKSRWW